MDSSTERKQDKAAKTQFVLRGFHQTAGIRSYNFEGIGDGRRTGYTVEVDLTLIPGFGIRIQDLPLLCRELLDERAEPDQIGVLVFSEQEMRSRAERIAAAHAEAEQRKKPPRHPVGANTGAGWRPTFP